MDQVTIAVCTPNLGSITAACTRAIMAAQNACQAAGRPYMFLHCDIETVIVGKARSLLTRVALDAQADVLFFVDQDMVVPPHTIVALMDRNVPIVGGLYIARRQPHLPQIYTTEETEGYEIPWAAQTTPRDIYWPIVEYPETPDLIEVDAIGAGCLMVRREVFEKMAEAQQAQDTELQGLLAYLQGQLAGAPQGEPERLGRLLLEHVRVMDPWWEFLTDEGEDMYFCRKARGLGYRIYCDLSVKCWHLGTVPIEEAHFLFIKPHLQRLPHLNQGGGEDA